MKSLSQKLNFQIPMGSACSKFLPAVQSQSDLTETKGAENSQGCLTKLVLVLHGNQLLIPLSFVPTQHQSGSLPSQSNFCLHVWMLNQLLTKLLKEFCANTNTKFNIAATWLDWKTSLIKSKLPAFQFLSLQNSYRVRHWERITHWESEKLFLYKCSLHPRFFFR